MNFVVENVSAMVRNMVGCLKTATMSSIQECQLTPENIPLVTQTLSEKFDQLAQPFFGLESEYKERKYFLANETLVEPEEVVLGHKTELNYWKYKSSVGERFFLLRSHKNNMLKLFLESPGVWHAIENYRSKNDSILRDFHDGS